MILPLARVFWERGGIDRRTDTSPARTVECRFSSTILDAKWGLRAQPRNVFGRMLDYLRILRLRPPHRRILQAAYRGQRQVARLLAKEIHGDRAQS